MTVMGWVQIALYCAILLAITAPLGAHMTRVFQGERTFLSFLLRPVERGIYWLCGVDEREEQLPSERPGLVAAKPAPSTALIGTVVPAGRASVARIRWSNFGAAENTEIYQYIIYYLWRTG